MDPVVHFELPADDLGRAQAFYRACFGWSLMGPPGMRYVFAATTPADPKTMMPLHPGAINGGMLARQDPVRTPVVTVKVASIDAALAAVVAHGGKAVRGKADVGPGYAAYFQDPEGNVMGLFEDKPRGP